MVRLAPGKTMDDVIAWGHAGFQGEVPFDGEFGSMGALGPGERGWARLQPPGPGEYVLLCFVPGQSGPPTWPTAWSCRSRWSTEMVALPLHIAPCRGTQRQPAGDHEAPRRRSATRSSGSPAPATPTAPSASVCAMSPFRGRRTSPRYDDPFDAFPKVRELEGVAMLKAGVPRRVPRRRGNQVAELEDVLDGFPADVVISRRTAVRSGTRRRAHRDPPGGDRGRPVLDARRRSPAVRARSAPMARRRRTCPQPRAQRRGAAQVRRCPRQVAATSASSTASTRPASGSSTPWSRGDLCSRGASPASSTSSRCPRRCTSSAPTDRFRRPAWEPPGWWGELDRGLPIVHLTQGTIRAHPGELVLPVVDALADEHVLVVVTTGAVDPGGAGPIAGQRAHGGVHPLRSAPRPRPRRS